MRAILFILAACCACAPPDEPLRALRDPTPPRGLAGPTTAPSASAKPPPKARPVIVLDGPHDAPLFVDELAKVRAAALRALEANDTLPVTILSEKRLATLRAVAKAGKLREGGKKCAEAPTEDDVILAAHPDALSAAFALVCSGARCNSDLAVVPFDQKLRLSGEPALLEAQATPSDPTSVASWEKALAAEDLRARKPTPASNGGASLRFGVGSAFSFHLRGAFGFATDPLVSAFDEAVARAKKCGTKKGGDLLLAVDAKGKVTRCQHDSACVCQAFSQQRFEAGAEGRRLRAFVQEADADADSSGLRKITDRVGLAGPEPAAGKARVILRSTNQRQSMGQELKHRTALAACFEGISSKLRFRLLSTLDESGRVSDARLEQHDLSEAQRDCVLRVAKTLGHRCPDEEGDVAKASYVVEPTARP